MASSRNISDPREHKETMGDAGNQTWIFWNWLEEQPVLVTTQPSLQPSLLLYPPGWEYTRSQGLGLNCSSAAYQLCDFG